MKTLFCMLLVTSISFAQNTLSFFTVIKNNSGSVDGLNYPTSVVVSPDNKNVYVTGYKDSALVVFNRDTATGALTYSACFKNGKDVVEGLGQAVALSVSPDNKNVYVAGFADSAVMVFNRDRTTGALKYNSRINDEIAGVDGLWGAVALSISPDNKNVYVAGYNDNAVAVFKRDTATGSLMYDGCFKNGQFGVEGLGGAMGIIASPDNKNVYVAGYISNAVVVFNRDRATGALTYSACINKGKAGVDGLRGAASLSVSPDNKNVYVTGLYDSTLLVFNRDTATGALTYGTRFKDGRDGVDGLWGAKAIIVSPDNKNVYVTGFYDSALAVFNRDTATGALTYAVCFKDGQGGVDGLAGAMGIMASPDNKNVYVTGGFDNAVAVFSVQPTSILPQVSKTLFNRTTAFSAFSTGRFYTIAFNTRAAGSNNLSLFNAQGKLVQKVFDNYCNAGDHTIHADFSTIQRGIYFLSLRNELKSRTINIMIAK